MPVTAASIVAGGSVLGGASAGGLFGGGGSAEVDFFAIRKAQRKAKKDLLFGNSVSGTDPLDISTPFSSLSAETGAVDFDPLTRGLGLDALNTVEGSLGGTRNALLGNANAFERARVNPLMEQLSVGRAERQRELGRTGVRGTFADRSIEDFDIAGERAIGDARAIAANDTITAVNAIDTALFNAKTGVGTNLFNQELKGLGLGLDAINIINGLVNNFAVGAASTAGGSAAAQALIDQSQLENLTRGIGAGLTTFGNALSPSPTFASTVPATGSVGVPGGNGLNALQFSF